MTVESVTSQDNICVYSLNVNDGVGDTVAAIKIAEELHKLKDEHQLPIVGIINVQRGSPNETIIALLQTKIDLFDKVYLLSNDPELLQMPLPRGVTVISEADYKQSEPFIKTLNTSKLYLDIYNQNSTPKCGELFNGILPTATTRIRLSELGVKCPEFGEKVYDLDLTPTGIWIDSHETEDLDTRAERLLAFNNKEYVSMLLGKDQPTLKDAEQYLESHHFMPGYVQKDTQALFFIMSYILKHCDENGELTSNCDFHIPTRTVNPDLLKKAMQDLGLPIEKLCFIDPKNIHADSGIEEPKIRIISGYFLDDKDYESLYLISNDGAACSGDNSFQQVISTHHPVFITGYGYQQKGNQFIRSFATQSFKDYLEFSDLKDYADAMLACTKLQTMEPIMRARNEEAEYQTILSQARMVAKTMQDPQFTARFETLRTEIHDNNNFTKKFPSIIRKALKIVPEDIAANPKRIRP